MVIFCVVNIATADREFSAKENRALEQRPKLTISGIESGRWMKQYESYVSDQFAGRDFWVALKSRIDLIAGKRKANGVFKGKDHYLLEDIARPDEEQLKANAWELQEANPEGLLARWDFSAGAPTSYIEDATNSDHELLMHVSKYDSWNDTEFPLSRFGEAPIEVPFK